MNEPIRRLSAVVLVMFLALMVAGSWIQVLGADDLNQDSRNVRTLYREFGEFRGPILVDGEAVVSSVPIDGPFNYQRTYAEGELYAAATGYYSIVFGRSGLEQTENALLSGSADELFWTRLGNLFAGEQQQGASVEMTLRASLQQIAAEQLGDQAGAVVALDPRTGAILAMVTSPTFDPAVLAIHNSAEVNRQYQALLADETNPLFNRAIAGDTYPPGSTFKLVVAAAALESGYTTDSSLHAPDQLELPQSAAVINNFEGASCDPDGRTTLADALRTSCNTAFADLGMSLGWSVVERKAADFGFGEQIEIPLNVSASQLPDDPDDAQTALSSIGQFDVSATPLQMAMVAAGIANDGVIMHPYLVDTVRAWDLTNISTAEPREYSQALTSSEAAAMTEMMIDVVESGTGRSAAISGVEVAGKTGTAETGQGTPPHSWFVGFAPADDPVVAVAVVVENAGTGGQVAAPVARDVMREALRLESEGQ